MSLWNFGGYEYVILFQVRLLPLLLLLREPAPAQGQEDQGGPGVYRGLQGSTARQAQGQLHPAIGLDPAELRPADGEGP